MKKLIKGRKSLILNRALSGVVTSLALCVSAAAAFAAPAASVAVFPFDLIDREQEGEFVKVKRPEETARLALITGELRKLMAESGRYAVKDVAGLAADIETAAPFHKCNACETDLAKKVGAELAVTGVVDKLNNSLMSVQVFVRDVASGELKRAGQAEIRGNTDELWLRGVRWIWKNRLNDQPAAAVAK